MELCVIMWPSHVWQPLLSSVQLELEKESHNLLEKTGMAVATFSHGTLISPVIVRSVVVNIISNGICLLYVFMYVTFVLKLLLGIYMCYMNI